MASVKGTGPLEAAVVHIHLAMEDDNEEGTQRSRLANHLVEELRDFGVDSVERGSTGRRPPGVKGGPAMDLSELIVSLSPMLVANLIRMLQHWVRRGNRRSLRITSADGITIEISGGQDWTKDDLERFAAQIIRASQDS